MARVPLDALVLDIHQLGLGPAAGFLAGTLEPPPAKAVAGALRSLRAIGALAQGEERLTPLGDAFSVGGLLALCSAFRNSCNAYRHEARELLLGLLSEATSSLVSSAKPSIAFV